MSDSLTPAGIEPAMGLPHAGVPLRTRFQRALIGKFLRHRRTLMMVLLVSMFAIAALAPRMFISVPSGHGGVLWSRFWGGTQTDTPGLGEGVHMIFPWDKIFIYDLRMQEYTQSYEAIANDGLHLTITISFRWHLISHTLPRLHKEVGADYVKVLLIPEIGSMARERISRYKAEELFAQRRGEIQHEIYSTIVADTLPNLVGGRHKKDDHDNIITLLDVLIKDMVLPDRVRGAIERKLEQDQIAQEYSFRIARERLESERKAIEAQGIQTFQSIVQAGISETYLKWRGIEATLQLATSNNAKIVVIGGGKDGLPLILNTADGSPAMARQHVSDQSGQEAPEVHADTASQLSGSINTTPAAANSVASSQASPHRPPNAPPPVEGQHAGADSSGVPSEGRPETPPASAAIQPAASEPPEPGPEFLHVLADTFGYRLERQVPTTFPRSP
jgi:regulator of protease activity HflC (stomatin/prohibitin superfamily)